MRSSSLVMKLLAAILWCGVSVGCGADEPSASYWDNGVLKNRSFTPTPEQVAAREKTRNEVIQLFDSLPQIPDTEMEAIESKEFSGKHHFTLNGKYQSYDTRLETILYSNTEPEVVCKAYQKYVSELGDEWMKPKKSLEDVYCNYDDIKKVRGFYITNVKASEKSGSFFSQITVKTGPVKSKNGRMWKTIIEFTADYTLNAKARQKCSPEAIDKGKWPCNDSQWHEPMAR